MDARQFGAFIAQRRKAAGMTQLELANKIHVTDKAVSRWERGAGFPDINTLEPLASALGVTLLELMQAHSQPQETITQESAQTAVSQTIALMQNKQKEELRYQMFGIAAGCVFLAAMTVLILGGKVLQGSIFVFAGIAAALCSHELSEKMPDPSDRQKKDLYKVIFITGVGTAALGGLQIVPKILLERYVDFLLLSSGGIIFFTLLRQTISVFLNRASVQRSKRMLPLLLAAAVVLAGAGIGVYAGWIYEKAVIERVTAAQQYASACILSDCGIQETDIIESVTANDDVIVGSPEDTAVAFLYRDPESGADRCYGYLVHVDNSFAPVIRDRGQELGKHIYAKTEESAKTDRAPKDVSAG